MGGSASTPADKPAETTPPDSGSWCHSQLDVEKFNYTWCIDNFSLRLEQDGRSPLDSSRFSSGSNEFEWFLRLSIKDGNDSGPKNCLALYVHLVSSIRPDFFSKIKFSIRNVNGEEAIMHETTVHFSPNKKQEVCNFIKRDFVLNKANGLLVNDELTIICEICVVGDSMNVSGQGNEFKVPECRLSEDFKNLFVNKRFSDVTLSASGREFQVHKSILVTRSAVFSAMFDHGFTEYQNNRVEIKDVDPDVLQELLQFIYTGDNSNIDGMASKLLAAADKYALERLRVKCEEILRLKLSIENAAETLILAHLHNAIQLKAQALKFIYTHAAEMKEMPNYKEMVDSYPHLVAETLAEATKHLQRSSGRVNDAQVQVGRPSENLPPLTPAVTNQRIRVRPRNAYASRRVDWRQPDQ